MSVKGGKRTLAARFGHNLADIQFGLHCINIEVEPRAAKTPKKVNGVSVEINEDLQVSGFKAVPLAR